MDEGYLKLPTDDTDNRPVFDIKLILKDFGLEGLSSLNFVLEFYPEPVNEDKQYAIWQLIQNFEDETITLSMLERIDEGNGWDTLQSLEIVFDLTGKFNHGSHYFSSSGKSLDLSDYNDLIDSYGYWIHLGGLKKPTRISTNLEDI